MENKKILPISIIILAVSIIFGSIWIGHSLEKVIKVQASQEKVLLTETESADYLNISVDEFRSILLKEKLTKEELGAYDPSQFISYTEIGEKTLFSKNGLNEWTGNNSFH